MNVNFPFYNLDDNEFSDILNHLNETQNSHILSIDIINNMDFNGDSFNGDRYTDNFDANFMNVGNIIRENCKYYVSELPVLGNNNVSLYFHNINSIVKHFDEMSNMFNLELDARFDVIGLCETKLTSDIYHLFTIDGYSMYNNFNTRKKGGLCLYIKNKYQNVKIREDLNLMSNSTETLFLECLIGCEMFIVGVVYRRPGTDCQEFIDNIDQILSKIKNENKKFYMMGDFNIDLLTLNDSQNASYLFNLLSSFNSHCTITKPTRVTSHSATLIDQFWTDNAEGLVDNGVIHSSVSDHFPIFSVFKIKINQKPKTNNEVSYKFIRNFNEENMTSFKNELIDTCWDLVVDIADVNVAYANFDTIFKALHWLINIFH